MKRFILIFICVALLCGLCAPAFAENEEIQYRTLTIKVPDTWVAVYVYTWEPWDLGEYPGTQVLKNGDVYELTVKSSMVNLVISGKTASHVLIQTSDIRLETNGKNVTVEVKEDTTCRITYEGEDTRPSRKPAIPNEGKPSEYRVTGNADWLGSWEPDNDLGIMYEVEPGVVYRKTFYDVEPGQYELKVTKDGKWDGAYGDADGGNVAFTVVERTNITVDLVLKDGVGVIDVYGKGSTNTDGPEDPEVTDPVVTDPVVTDPVVTDPVVTDPVVTDPVVTDPVVTDPVVTDPVVTDPVVTDPVITDPIVTDPATTDPTVPDATRPPEPASPDSNAAPSPLINQPLISGPLRLFGILAVCVYFIFLLRRRNRVSGEVTPDGKVHRRTRLSARAVTRAVKETMPAPSPALDDAVLEAVRKIKQTPNEP